MRSLPRRRLPFCNLIVAVGCLALVQLSFGANKQTKVRWETWGADYINGPMSAVDPAGAELLFYGVDATGGAAWAPLAKTVYSGSTRGDTGDVVELGYFRTSSAVYAPLATSDDLFKGVWTPLTSSTAIGDMSPSNTNDAGAFHLTTLFDSADPTNELLARHLVATGADTFNDDMSSGGIISAIDALDAAASASDPHFLAVRIYDIDTSDQAAPDSIVKTSATRYNTVSAPSWQWVATVFGGVGVVDLALHDKDTPSAAITTDLAYEFANSDYASDTDVKIGTGTNKYLNDASGVNSLDNVATITYHDGVDDNLNLQTAGIGSTILSGLTGGGAITGGTDGNTLTLFSAAGNTASFGNVTTANVTDDGSISGDVTVVKIGDGAQTIRGTLNIADTNNAASSGYLNLKAGILTLKPVSAGPTQSVEYIMGAGDLVIDNSNHVTHIVELGFAETATAQTFSGDITLSATAGNYDTLKVGGVTADDFDDHQKFTGDIGDDSSGATLKKTGSGKLTLSGSGSNFTGGVTIADGSGTVDGGIVVAGHANALGTGTTTIEHGKLSVAGGITFAETIAGQGANDNTNMKSVIGGGVGNSVGTITNDSAILNIGNENGEVDVVSPGIAHASSMSNGTSDYQVIGGNKDDAGSVDLTNSIGTMKINTLGLKAGGVFDWEITDFAGANGDGSDWDVLQFDTLAFDGAGTFDINIYGVKSDGTAGPPSGDLWASRLDAAGFLFLDGPNDGAITWGGVTDPGGAGYIDDYFTINDNAIKYASGKAGGFADWSVYYNGSGDFYLSYSVVPEPSTYVMVTGLLMLPGFQFLRRFRRRKNKGEE